jgi:electron transfer flavoprotein beta subunit
MQMKVVVCAKLTPATTAVYTVKNGAVSWEEPGGNKANDINPWDEYAIEEAIRLKENHGFESATIMTAGGEASLEVLRQGLARGCTEAFLISDPAWDGSGAQGTARVLAAAIRHAGANVALFGKQAIDGDTGLTPVMVARALGWTPLTYVSAIKAIDGDTITVERALERSRQTVSAKLPVVISVVKEINEPRYASFMGIRKAQRVTIPTLTSADLAVENAGPASANTDWSDISQPPARVMETEFITGDSAGEIARQLVEKLFAEKVI